MAGLIRKLKRDRAGFTLVELLAAMAVLAMVGAVVAAGIPAAQKAYLSAVDTSNAQILVSTTTTRLRDVLSQADPESVDKLASADAAKLGGDTLRLVKFTSYETGYPSAIANASDAKKLEGAESLNSDGLYLVEVNSTGAVVATPLVPAKAAAGVDAELGVTFEEITYDDSTGVFEVRGLTATRDGEPLTTEQPRTFKVKALAA